MALPFAPLHIFLHQLVEERLSGLFISVLSARIVWQFCSDLWHVLPQNCSSLDVFSFRDYSLTHIRNGSVGESVQHIWPWRFFCSPSSDARFELGLFDDWVKCFLCLHWCSDAQPEPFTLVLVYLFHSGKTDGVTMVPPSIATIRGVQVEPTEPLQPLETLEHPPTSCHK